MKKARYILALLCLLALAGTGCFSIPFIGGGGPAKDFEPMEADFDSTNVFIGYDDDGRRIVEIRLINQEVTAEKGLVINTRLFTTDNFEVVNIFRGLRSINYYPIERRFHRLELKYGRQKIKMKVSKNLQVKGDKPVDAAFEHTGSYTLLPDTIGTLKLKFQDVDRWGKMPVDSLGEWYASKEQFFQRQERNRRRSSLVESYRRRQEDDYTKKFTQYDSLYVTTNNAYVFAEKDVLSDILYTLNAGEQLDYGVSDGTWMEVPTPDSLREQLMPLFEARQQRAMERKKTQERNARASRNAAMPLEEIDTDLKFTGYMLDVMVQKEKELALAWETNNMLQPVDVPLFAKVLTDREAAEVARQDSIAKAYEDSVKAYADSIAAIATADSIAIADSIAAATAAAADTSGAVPAATAAPAGLSAAADSVAAAAADTLEAAPSQQKQQQIKRIPTSSDIQDDWDKVRRIVGPEGQVWEGKGPPPWSPRYEEYQKRHGGAADQEATGTENAEEPDSTSGTSADTTGTSTDQP